jgi:hypothetical protein
MKVRKERSSSWSLSLLSPSENFPCETLFYSASPAHRAQNVRTPPPEYHHKKLLCSTTDEKNNLNIKKLQSQQEKEKNISIDEASQESHRKSKTRTRTKTKPISLPPSITLRRRNKKKQDNEISPRTNNSHEPIPRHCTHYLHIRSCNKEDYLRHTQDNRPSPPTPPAPFVRCYPKNLTKPAILLRNVKPLQFL